MKGIFSKIFRNRKPIPNIGKVAIGFVGFWIAVWYSKHSSLSQAQYIFENTPLNEHIMKRMNIFGKDLEFSPNLLLFNGFLQSLYASWLEDREYLNYQVQGVKGFGEIFRFPIHQQIKKQSLKPALVIFILGAQGMSQATTNSIKECYHEKMLVIALNPQDFHNPDSLREAVKNLQQEYAGKYSHLYGVGFQYGGNLLVNAASLDSELFSGIMTLGNPLDLGVSQKKIEGSWSAKYWYYNAILKGRLSRIQKKDLPSEPKLYDLDKYIYDLPKQSDIVQLKQKNSSINHLKNVKTPYLLVQSAEDAFTTSLQDERMENSKIICIETKRGGHHEWFQGYTSRLRWGTRMLVQYIKASEYIRNEKSDLLV